MLDIKRLQYLDAIYRYKNFTRASEEMYVSQPAISAAVNAMEREYGVKLVNRNSKDIYFTTEGEQFMLHVSRILRECREAECLLADFSDAKKQTLHLGLSPTFEESLLPRLYSDFFPKWPNANIHIDEGPMLMHIEKIQNELLDLSFNAFPSHTESNTLTFIPITTSEVGVLMRPDHPLAKYSRVPIALLEKESLAILSDKSKISTLMKQEFERRGLVPCIGSVHDQINVMINNVRFGNKIAFVNMDKTNHASGCDHLALRPLEEPVVFEGGFIVKKGRRLPRMAREMITFVQALY